MLMRDDLTLCGGHTLETYIVLLSNVAPINLIKVNK